MPHLTAAPGAFSVRGWLDSQDVSERDETLDEESARVWTLHRALIPGAALEEEERQVNEDEAVKASRDLARSIVAQDGGLMAVAQTVNGEEPRFAVMALVDLLAVLRSSGDLRAWEEAVRGVALVVPEVIKGLVVKSGEGDICGDAMAYAVTMVSFLIGEEGKSVLSADMDETKKKELVEAASGKDWLRAAMRVWKDKELAAHVPGMDEQDECHGLGFLVTVFLDALVGGERGVGSEGVRALCEIGEWAVSFLGLRLYEEGIGEDERVRLLGVLWAFVKGNPRAGARLVLEDAQTMRSVAESIKGVARDGDDEDGDTSEMSDRDGSRDGRREGGDEDSMVVDESLPQGGVAVAEHNGNDAVLGALDAMVDDNAQGSACSVEEQDESGRRFVGEEVFNGNDSREGEWDGGSSDAADPEELMLAARRAVGVFAHVRFLSHAVREAPGADVRRRRFFRRIAPHPWLWSGAKQASELIYSLAGYELALGDRCAEFVRAPCSRGALSFFTWRAAEWLAVDPVEWRTREGQVLAKEEILEKLVDVAGELCNSSAVPLLAQCAAGLAQVLLERKRGEPANRGLGEGNTVDSDYTTSKAPVDRILNVCEWCLANDTQRNPRLKACGGCESVFFCDQEHMRAHWKRYHKRSCPGKGEDPFRTSALAGDKFGVLSDRASGESLGAVYARDGLRSLLAIHGAFLVSLGMALVVLESENGDAQVKALPRGQVIREVWGKLGSDAARDIGRVMFETCGHFNGSFGLVAIHDSSNSAVQVSLFRPATHSSTTATCSHPGCCGHDVMCSSSFLPVLQ